VERANKVILAHLGVKNPMSVAFIDDCTLPHDQGLIGWSRRPGRILILDKHIVGHRLAPFKAEIDFLNSPIARRVPARIEIDKKYRADLHAVGAILAHKRTHLFLRFLWYDVDEVLVDMAAIVIGLGILMRMAGITILVVVSLRE